MTRIFLILSLLISSSANFAFADFSNSTESLIMRDGIVASDIVYSNVTRPLILADANSTVSDASLEDTYFSTTALNTFSESGLRVDFAGCALSGTNQITCLTKIVTVNQNLQVSAYATGFRSRVSRLFDNLSNEYPASTVSAPDMAETSHLVLSLMKDIPVEVRFIYRNINPSATSISLFEPMFEYSDTLIKSTFTNISF